MVYLSSGVTAGCESNRGKQSRDYLVLKNIVQLLFGCGKIIDGDQTQCNLAIIMITNRFYVYKICQKKGIFQYLMFIIFMKVGELAMKLSKRLTLACLVASATLCISACSSNYVISTDDGHMITTHGKPVKDKDTGLISYKDADGNTHQLHQQDVKEIVEK